MTIRKAIAKSIRHGTAIRVIVAWLIVGPRIIMVGLVWVEVWKGRDGVWVMCRTVGFWN
jgi:hypothetical protein